MRKIVVFICIPLMISCSTSKVTSDYTKDFSFSEYLTFTLAYHDKAESKTSISSINYGRVEDAIASEFEARGLVDHDDPEITVVWGYGIQSNKSYTTTSTVNGTGFGRRRYSGYGTGYINSNTHEYTTNSGNLHICIVDNETDEMVWVGQLSQDINYNAKHAEEKINKAVAKILAEL